MVLLVTIDNKGTNLQLEKMKKEILITRLAD